MMTKGKLSKTFDLYMLINVHIHFENPLLAPKHLGIRLQMQLIF